MLLYYHVIEVMVRYLTTDEGGRKSGVNSGYRGQFYYDGDDWDGFQFFPDHPHELVELGDTVRAFVEFRTGTWGPVHSKKISLGMSFQIREGSRKVGEGTVTRLDVGDDEMSPWKKD